MENELSSISEDLSTKKNLKSLVNLLLICTIALLGVAAILFINFQVINGWFGKNGPANLGSIEVSYVSMGKFLVDFGFTTWAPFWYLGFPFHVFYTPLLPIFELFLHQLTQKPLWEIYRLLTGIAYILAPVSLFFC